MELTEETIRRIYNEAYLDGIICGLNDHDAVTAKEQKEKDWQASITKTQLIDKQG